MIFIDDFLVYSKNMEEHIEHLQKLFQTIRKNNLFPKISECVTGVPQVDFIRCKVSKNGVYMQNG